MTDLSQAENIREKLLAAARQARHHAYAPYSGYAVGAAVWCDEGNVFAGANVENASFGLTVCAERVAVYRAISEGAQHIRAVAVVTRDGGTPCGACRQVLAEFGDEDTIVWCASEERGDLAEYRLGELLPAAFHLTGRSTGEDEIILGGV